MSLGLSSLLKGLPGLLGVISGIVLFTASESACYWMIAPVGVFALLWVLLLVGNAQFPKRPRLGLLLLEPWVLSAVCLVALSTELLLGLTIWAPIWLGQQWDKNHRDAIGGALIGAMTTYLATAWTKDVQDAKGPFLPAEQFKRFATGFLEAHNLTGDRAEVEACDAETVPSAKISGWGRAARWQRAALLERYLRSGRP